MTDDIEAYRGKLKRRQQDMRSAGKLVSDAAKSHMVDGTGVVAKFLLSPGA